MNAHHRENCKNCGREHGWFADYCSETCRQALEEKAVRAAKYRCGACGDHGTGCTVCGSPKRAFEWADFPTSTVEVPIAVRAVRVQGPVTSEHHLELVLNRRLLLIDLPVVGSDLAAQTGFGTKFVVLPGMHVAAQVTPETPGVRVQWEMHEITPQECVAYYSQLSDEDVKKLVGKIWLGKTS